VPEKDDKLIYGAKGGSAPSYAGGQTPWLTRVVLLVIFIALGGVAFWGIHLQTELQQSRATLADYDGVINELRKQLSVTDESINQTSAQADDRLKELDFEIPEKSASRISKND